MRTLLILLAITAPLSAQMFYPAAPVGQCGPGGCPPRDDYPDYPDDNGPSVIYRPRPAPEPPSINATPPVPPQPSVDPKAIEAIDKQQKDSLTILNEIKVAIQNNPGCKCEPCDLSPLQARFDELIAKLDALSVAIGGIHVEQPPSPQPAGTNHIVIVADRNDPYWPRLSEEIEKTKDVYNGIQVAPPPRFEFGAKPQAVIYENSVPVRIVKGEQGVLDLLSKLRRNMPL